MTYGIAAVNEDVAELTRPYNAPRPTFGCDPLYLFACYYEWEHDGNLLAFQQLLAALDDPDEETRLVAEAILRRPSPRRPRSPADANYFDW